MWENTTQYYYIHFIQEIFIFVAIVFSTYNILILKLDVANIYKNYQKPKIQEKEFID